MTASTTPTDAPSMTASTTPTDAPSMTDSTTPSTRRFFRSREDKMLGGVCGGVAQRLDVDPVIVRIGTVVLASMGGIGVVAYVAAWILMPFDEETAPSPAAASA
jgi:phage shock protein C